CFLDHLSAVFATGLLHAATDAPSLQWRGNYRRGGSIRDRPFSKSSPYDRDAGLGGRGFHPVFPPSQHLFFLPCAGIAWFVLCRLCARCFSSPHACWTRILALSPGCCGSPSCIPRHCRKMIPPIFQIFSL